MVVDKIANHKTPKLVTLIILCVLTSDKFNTLSAQQILHNFPSPQKVTLQHKQPQPVKAFSREFKKSISAHKSYIVIVAIWNIEVCSRLFKGRHSFCEWVEKATATLSGRGRPPRFR